MQTPPARAAEENSDESSHGGARALADARPWLGIELEADEPARAGVRVASVVPGSPAERAGLAAGDVLISLDGDRVDAPEDVVRWVGARSVDQEVAVAFERAGTSRLVRAVLEAFPDDEEMMRRRYVGSHAPAFDSLKSVQGILPDSIGALRGKVVVLEFWASWCAVCRFMVPTLNGWHDRFQAQGGVVVGLTTDSVLTASRAARQLDIAYALAADESGRTTQAYRALALPTLFVIDRQGVVRDVVVGYSGDRLLQVEALVERLLGAPAAASVSRRLPSERDKLAVFGP